MWLPVGRACGLLLGIGLATSGCAASNNARPRADERVAYCLDAPLRGPLAEVATRLDIAVPPGRVLGEWRGADFDRACDALMAARAHPIVSAGPGIPSWLTDLLAILKSVLLLLAGGLLTLLTGGLRDAGIRRRLQAAQLRTATDNFVAAGETFLEDKVDATDATASGQSVRDRRQELMAKLHEAKALYRRKVDPEAPLQLLTGKLDRRIQRKWELDRTETQRDSRVSEIRNDFTTLVDCTEAINRKLERSWLARLGGTK